jgi:hypothetical protein
VKIPVKIVQGDTVSLWDTHLNSAVTKDFPSTYFALGKKVDQLYAVDTYGRGCFLLATAVIIGLLLPATVLRFAKYWFILGLMMLAGMSVSCAFCKTTSDWARIDEFLPGLSVLAYGIVAVPLFVRPIRPWPNIGYSVVVALCVAPTFLIFFFPKACPFCAILLIANVVLARYFEFARQTTSVLIGLPLVQGRSIFVVLVFIFVSKLGMATGILHSSFSPPFSSTNLNGTQISKYVNNINEHFTGNILVGQPHCSACEIARVILEEKQVGHMELTQCSDDPKGPCVKKDVMASFVSPTILTVRNGKVQQSFEGWPSSPAMQSDLLSVLKENQPEKEEKNK